MLYRDGITLIEIIVVLVIAGICAALVFPSYTAPMERSRAGNAQNNLLAIYSAQKNILNNSGVYCLSTNAAQPNCAAVSANCANTLAAINCNLSLNMQDDGSYNYSCAGTACTASRNGASNLVMVLNLNAAVQLHGVNPTCTSTTGNANWCP